MLSQNCARLVAVAGDLFYRIGIRAVSIDDIVSATDISKPTLYRNFRSKDDLIAACVAAEIHATAQALVEATTKAGPGARDQARAIVGYYAKAIASPPARGLLAINAAIEFPDPDHPVRPHARRAGQQLEERLYEVLAVELGARAGPMAAHLTLLVFGACTACQAMDGPSVAARLIEAADAVLSALPP